MNESKRIFPAGYDALVANLPFPGKLDCDTAEVIAGSKNEITLTYTVGAASLADGAWLKVTFRFYSDWALFQTKEPAGADYVSAELLPRDLIDGETPSPIPSLNLRFDQKGHERPFQKALLIDIVDGFLRPGDRIVLRLGDRRHGGPGTRVQTFADDDFRFRAYVDPVGTSRFADIPGDVVLRILPGPPAKVRIHTPRLVRPGTKFPVTVVAEDAWGNACRPDGLSFDLGVNGQTQTLQPGRWAAAKAMVAAGIDGELSLQATANPAGIVGDAIVTVDRAAPFARAFFADLHVHSSNTVGTNSTDHNLAYGRDVSGLDVFGYTANDFNIRADRWRADVELIKQFNTPGEYVCFAGTEWNGNSAAGGDRNVIFLGGVQFPEVKNESVRSFEWNEDTQARAITPHAWPVTRLHETYADASSHVLMIPHVGGRRCNLDFFDPDLEHLIEVASAWGHFDWFYRDAIQRGYRVGVSAAGDEHRGRPGGGAPGVDVFGVRGGLTGIIAEELTPSAIRRALLNRRTWATTGDRIVGLLRCGDFVQGDLCEDPAYPMNYRLLGTAGWEWIAAYTDRGLLWKRNLQAEVGYSNSRIRVRWGGARVYDRYRWARWKGTIHNAGAADIVSTFGLEHLEETIVADGNGVRIKTETYGDADGVVLDIGDLASLDLSLDFTIEGFDKTGSPLNPAPHKPCPRAQWRIRGDELTKAGTLRRDLPGCELFIAIERVTEVALPIEVSGEFFLPTEHRCVYITGRQVDDEKVWTSPIFIDR